MNDILNGRLQNNIKIFSCRNDSLHSINIGFYFRTGIIYENARNNGITHLCEHLFFRHLGEMNQKDLYFAMESIGTTMRAKTYADFVCFDITVRPKFFDKTLDIIVCLLSDFEFCEEDLIKEREVVKKQIDFKSHKFIDFVNENYFVSTKLKMPIMGTTKTVDNITISDVNVWKKRFFHTGNVCAVLTGAFSGRDYQRFINTLEKLPPCLSMETLIPIINPKNFCNRTVKSDVVVNTEWEISDISITFDIDSNDVNVFCANLLCSILCEGVGSRLSMLLREKEAVTDEIVADVNTFSNIKRMSIEFSVLNCELEKSLTLAFDEIINFVKNLSENDLKSVIEFFTENQEYIFDSPRNLNFYLGWNGYVQQGDVDITDIIERYRNITLEDLAESAKKIFLSKNLILTITNNRLHYSTSKLRKKLLDFRDKLDKIK